MPGNTAGLRATAQSLYAAGDTYGAADAMQKVVASADATLADLLTLSRLSLELGDYELSEELLSRLLARKPAEPAIVQSAVQVFIATGNFQEAEATLIRALGERPTDPTLLALSLAHLREIKDDLLARAAQTANALPPTAELRTSILYPLARVYDTRGEYDRAWQCATEANTATRARRGPESTIDAATLRRTLVSRIDAALGIANHTGTCEIAKPVWAFLIGAPRTGGSLLQSILAAHDDCASLGERGALVGALNALADVGTVTDAITKLSELRSADTAGLARMGVGSSVVVDKTPHHFYVAALLQKIYPNSVFINLLRDPRDVAISMLFHDFSPAFPEALSVDLILAMLQARNEGLARYRSAGIAIKSRMFDQFVAKPAQLGATVTALLGLNWDDDSLIPERRRSAVNTFSAAQVRETISAPVTAAWRRYATELEPWSDAFDALEAAQLRAAKN